MECSVFFEGEGGDLIASEPLIVRITLFSKLKDVLFWLVLLPFLLLKENRSRKVLWIFLPYGAWMGVAVGLDVFWGGASELMMPLPTFLCGLLLAGHRSQRWNGWIVLLATVIFAVLIHWVWISAGQVENVMYSAIGSGILFLLALVSVLLARLCCRGRYDALKLALFLLPIILLLSLLTTMVTGFLMFLKFAEMGFGSMAMMLLGMAVPAVVVGMTLYLLLLSFLAVPFSMEFFRSRLCGLLKLKRDVPPVLEPPPMPPAHS